MSALNTKSLILVRHGITKHNQAGIMQGQLDTELLHEGFLQAEATAELLKTTKPLRVISSDLRRAVDTGEIIAKAAGVKLELDKRLRETGLGEWEGLSHTEVDRSWPDARMQWRATSDYTPPGGESRREVAQRTRAVVTELLREETAWGEDDRPIILVAHGGSIVALTSFLLGIPPENWTIFEGLGNASWVHLHLYPTDQHWRLAVWNAVARRGAVDIQ